MLRMAYLCRIEAQRIVCVCVGGGGGEGRRGGGAGTDSSSFSSKTMDWLQTAILGGTEEVQEIAMQSESTVHPDQ